MAIITLIDIDIVLPYFFMDIQSKFNISKLKEQFLSSEQYSG